MGDVSRRSFLERTGRLAAGSIAMSAAQYRRVSGANERVVLAGIGIGGRNSSLLSGFIKFDEIDIKYLCDVNEKREQIQRVSEFIHNARGKTPRFTAEMHEVLEDSDVQAVIIATPDHWHGPATVFACQAGDVYVEEPISHNIWEGRRMVEAARKYDRVVQCGTQNRSAEYNIKAREYIQGGKLGKVHFVKVFNMEPGGRFTKDPTEKSGRL